MSSKNGNTFYHISSYSQTWQLAIKAFFFPSVHKISIISLFWQTQKSLFRVRISGQASSTFSIQITTFLQRKICVRFTYKIFWGVSHYPIFRLSFAASSFFQSKRALLLAINKWFINYAHNKAKRNSSVQNGSNSFCEANLVQNSGKRYNTGAAGAKNDFRIISIG